MSANINEIDWGNISFGRSTQNANFYKLQQGLNRIRIVSKATATFTHMERTSDGKFRSIPCLGQDECPLCKAGSRAKRQLQCLVIDKHNWNNKTRSYDGDIEVKIATLPYSVAKDVASISRDPDYGDVTQFDLKIEKSGQKLETTYTTTPAPDKIPLTDAELAAIENAPNPKDVIKIYTADEIKNLNLAIFDKNEETAPEAEKAKDGNWDEFD